MTAPDNRSSISKALDLLEIIGDHPGSTLAELAKLTGLPKGTCHRLLSTLCEAQFLRKDELSGAYHLGFLLLKLGAQAEEQADLRSLALPYMYRLRDLFGETMHLAVREGPSVYFVAKVESERVLRPWTVLGERIPLHVGASAKCIAAFMPESEVLAEYTSGESVRFTPNTTGNVDTLLIELRLIRTVGFCVTHGERYEGVTAVATPVFGRQGDVVGALAFGGPSVRMSPGVIESMAHALLEASEALSRDIGFRGSWKEVLSASLT